MTNPLFLYRTTDPSPSEKAANVAAKGMSELKVRVMDLIHVHRRLSSSELNDQYQFAAARMPGWKRVAYDSPRKRAGELVEAGYVEVVDERPGLYGVPESVYALTEKGQRAITLGGKKQ